MMLCKQFLCSFILGLNALGAQAELIVIYDSGKTRPLAPLLVPFQQESSTELKQKSKPIQPQQHLGSADLNNLLPLRSPGLSPGVLSINEGSAHLQRLAQGNARPFFLVGADGFSRQWLAENQKQLKTLGAVGMLVQAESIAEVEHMAEIAQGLPITLGSASDIAQALGIKHYPVLITSKGLVQ